MLVHIRVYLYIFMRDLSKLSAFCKKSIKLYHGRRVRLIHTTSCTRTYYMKYISVDHYPLAQYNMAQQLQYLEGSSESLVGLEGSWVTTSKDVVAQAEACCMRQHTEANKKRKWDIVICPTSVCV